MTNKDKNTLAKLCKECDSFYEVLILVAELDITCSKQTVKKVLVYFS